MREISMNTVIQFKHYINEKKHEQKKTSKFNFNDTIKKEVIKLVVNQTRTRRQKNKYKLVNEKIRKND